MQRSSASNTLEEHLKLAADENTLSDFWLEQSKLVDWYKQPTQGLDQSQAPFFKWFSDGILNMSYNCFDRHINKGKGSDTALIYESPLIGVSKTYTYSELLDKVSRFANVLQRHGVTKGDRVIIYMPMIPEAVIAIHACARIGAIHSVVSAGFAAPELAKRILDSTPKLIVSASCRLESNGPVDHKELLEEAVEIAQAINTKRIIVQREMKKCELKEGIDFEFYQELADAQPTDPVPLGSLDPLYILYTSGTTGVPKGMVRPLGSYVVSECHSLTYGAGLGNKIVTFCASDIGLVTCHSMGIYGPFLAGNISILFEGKSVGTPDAGIIWQICEKHKVTSLFMGVAALRAIRKEDPEGKRIAEADLSSLKTFISGGEIFDTATLSWIASKLPKTCSVIDGYGQTESTRVFVKVKNSHLFKNKTGTVPRYSVGRNIFILGDNAEPVPSHTMGAICLKLPLYPGFASTIYNDDAGFIEKYMTRYPGYYFTGDLGFIDEDKILHIISRADDIIKIGGHRISTGKIEEILSQHPDVIEAAVVGVKDQVIGEKAVGFVALKAGVTRDHAEIERECIENVTKIIGSVTQFSNCVILDKLPHNKTEKIARLVLKQVANGEDVENIAGIEESGLIENLQMRVRKSSIGDIGLDREVPVL